MPIQTLKEITVKNAKAKEKAYKLFDGHGLYLYVAPTGGKSWRYNFRFQGIPRTLTIGQYPEIGLKDAREKHQKARSILANGINPAEQKRNAKRGERPWDSAEITFEGLANEFLEGKKKTIKAGTCQKMEACLKRYSFPHIGAASVSSLTASLLLDALNRIKATGADSAPRATVKLWGAIFRYGVATGRLDKDLSIGLSGGLAHKPVKHFARLTNSKEIGEFLNKFDSIKGKNNTVKIAFKLAPLVFLRPSELVGGKWAEIDFKAADWRIPAERMKGNKEHIVPLSTQALGLLKEIHVYTGAGPYIFQSPKKLDAPITTRALSRVLRVDLKTPSDKMTLHGFRGMASTKLNEMGFNGDWIEKQLAHNERNSVRAAYNHSDYLKDRREMMQKWADYLDRLKAEAAEAATAK
jgi:integrase